MTPLLLAEAADDPELHAIFRSVLIDLLAGPVIYRLFIDAGDPTVVEQRGTSHLQTLLEGLAPRPSPSSGG